MRRIAITFIFAIFVFVASAQEQTVAIAADEAVSVPKTDWLTAFNSIKIDGPMNVVLKEVATPEEARITYNTKGNITSKFKFEVDRNGELVVSERSFSSAVSASLPTKFWKLL